MYRDHCLYIAVADLRIYFAYCVKSRVSHDAAQILQDAQNFGMRN